MSAPNVLTLLPARARFVIYVTFGLVYIAAEGAEKGFGSVGRPDPTWLIVALAVLQYLAVPVLALAAVHVAQVAGATSSPSPAPRRAAVDDGTVSGPIVISPPVVVTPPASTSEVPADVVDEPDADEPGPDEEPETSTEGGEDAEEPPRS